MWIEIFGVVTGILYVILEVKQNRLLWPLGIITSAAYVYIFFAGKFYADMGLQVYYVLISIYGWYYWSRGGSKRAKGELPVVRINRQQLFLLFLTFALSWVGIYFVLDRYTDSTVPLGDSFTTALAIVATWMLTRKIIEQWFLWIIANVVSIGLYIYKGLYPTVILYAVYAGMAVYGYMEWKRSMNNRVEDEKGE
ncbi:MAG: nicotinamide mononucleotide transporter [Bacteroidales bacterium]|nr:nicotinamide mononucleotide transporter [Bacteroidales bacterium]